MLQKTTYQVSAHAHVFLYLPYVESLQNSSAFVPEWIVVIKKWYHIHPDAVEKTCLMDRNKDSVIPGLDDQICLFWRFYSDGKHDGAPTGCTDAKIAIPSIDIFKYFRNNRHTN
jgi:hypothetical protein